MGAFITILSLIGWLSIACGPLRVHTYLIPAKIEPRWITIEYDNPRCTRLKESAFGQEFVIPESGFLCTSSAMYTGCIGTNTIRFTKTKNALPCNPAS